MKCCFCQNKMSLSDKNHFGYDNYTQYFCFDCIKGYKMKYVVIYDEFNNLYFKQIILDEFIMFSFYYPNNNTITKFFKSNKYSFSLKNINIFTDEMNPKSLKNKIRNLILFN